MTPPQGAPTHADLRRDRRLQSADGQLRTEWLTSADRPQLDSWDEFLMNSPRGHYCQLSTWLRSFQPYGFRFSVLTARATASGAIVGGIAVLEIGNALASLMSVPVGPIVEVGHESVAGLLLAETLHRARESGAFLLQLQLPCSNEVRLPALIERLDVSNRAASQPGLPFATGTAPNQMLWIAFPENLSTDAWEEELLRRFSGMTRRNIRLSQQQGLDVREVTKEAELRQAYTIIEMNGVRQGYATRGWREFGPTVLEQVASRQAVMLVVRHNDQAVGAHYGVLAGRRYSYLMGGTTRDAGNLKIGHCAHWSAMRKAKDLDLLGYDLTSGGSTGVMRFKMGFRPQHIPFISPRHYVLSRWRFEVFRNIYPLLRRHKRLVSRVLSISRRLIPRA